MDYAMSQSSVFNKNNNLKISDNLLIFACFLNIAISTLPVVDYYANFMVSAIPMLLVITAVLVKNDGNVFVKMVFMTLAILAWSFMSYMTIYKTGSTLTNKLVNDLIVWVPSYIALETKQISNPRVFKRLLNIMVVFMMITCVTTIMGYTADEYASRKLASGTALYDTASFTRANIGGYGFIYSLMLMIPTLCYLYSISKRKGKLLFGAALILFVYCIIESQYTMAILCSVLALVLILMRVSTRNALITILSIIIGFLIFKKPIGSLFYWLSETIKLDYVASRFLQLSEYLLGKNLTGNIERLEVYEISLKSFFQNPIFGANMFEYHTNSVGGHSAIFDILAAMGLVGLIFYLVLFFKFVQIVLQPFSKIKNRYVFITILLFLVLSFVNTTNFSLIYLIVFFNGMCLLKLGEEPQTGGNT